MGAMIAGVAISAIVSAISGYMGAEAQKEAYEIMAKASDRERAMLESAYNEAYGPGSYNSKMQELGLKAGQQYYDRVNDTAAWDRYVEGEKAYKGPEEFSFTAEDLFSDPSYAFRRQQGIDAIDQSNAAQGLNLSSRAVKDVENFASDLASQEYQNAYARKFGEYRDNRDFDYGAWKDRATQYYQNLQAQLAGLANVSNQGVTASLAQAEGLKGLAKDRASADWAGSTARANAGIAETSGITSIMDALSKGVLNGTGAYASGQYDTPSATTASTSVPTNTTPTGQANTDFSSLFLQGYNPSLDTTNARTGNLIGV